MKVAYKSLVMKTLCEEEVKITDIEYNLQTSQCDLQVFFKTFGKNFVLVNVLVGITTS